MTKKKLSENIKKGVKNVLMSAAGVEKKDNFNFTEMKIIYKKEIYDIDSSDDTESTLAFLSQLSDRNNEFFTYKFVYKGLTYHNTLGGKRSAPITDENAIFWLEVMIAHMKEVALNQKMDFSNMLKEYYKDKMI